MINIDKIYSDRLQSYDCLIFTRNREGYFLDFENLGAAMLLDSDCLHCLYFLHVFV
jgi:hypothetical protein